MSARQRPRPPRRDARAVARRRRRLSANVIVLAALLMAGGVYTALLAPSSDAADAAATTSAYSPEQVEAGRALFEQGCSSCHGLNAEGGAKGPSLIGVGAAAVDFQVGTGRMPLAANAAQAPRKAAKYDQAQIDELAAYVSSLAPGPAVPEVDVQAGDTSLGKELFQQNCAQCHNSTGGGGALTFGKYAPSLAESTPVQVVEAMHTGPESMPVFGPSQFDEEEWNSIAKYVTGVQSEANPGGAGIGRFGPVPEGVVIWVVGIGALLGMVLWIGARA